jgi:hypothetical protein
MEMIQSAKPLAGVAKVWPAAGRDGGDRRVQMYGWDARTETWSGPTELNLPLRGAPRVLEALRAMPGSSWYGPVNCGASGQPPARFFTLIHALGDSAVAMIYCHDSRTGPAEIVAVVPPELRARLRPEFAFEFVAFARFLEALSEAGALTVHDLIASAVAEAQPSDALVFSISSGLWTSDQDHVLCDCVEKIAASMLQWLAEQTEGMALAAAS